MDALERYRGHFYNWYDTRTLQPLRPALRLDGRQRQPRRPPADAARRPARAGRRAAARRRAVRRPRRHAAAAAAGRCAAAATRCPLARFAALLADTRAAPPRTPDDRAPHAQALTQRCRRRARGLAADARHGRCRSTRRSRSAEARALGAGADAPVRGRRAPRCAALSSPRRRRRAPRPVARGRARRAARARCGSSAERAGAMAEMDFDFLYDPARDLLAIGYNVDDRRLDAGLLRPAGVRGAAGELRRHRAGPAAAGALVRARPPARRTLGGEPVLLSWSGSMFEYLMPLLVMPSYEDTLLDETMRGGGRAADRATAASAACRGASPSRATTPPTRSSTTSTAPSACRGWASSAAWPTTWWSRPTRRCWR